MSVYLKNILCIVFFVVTMLANEVNAETFPELSQWLAVLKKNPEDIETLKKVSSAYLEMDEYEESLKYAKKLVEAGEKKGDRDFAVLYGNIGIAHAASMLGDRETTFKAFEKARTIAEMTDNHDALTSVYNGLGMYYINMANDPYSSISYFYDALKQVKITGNQKYHSRILSNLSSAYLMREDMEGLKYCLEANALAKEIGDEMSRIHSSVNLADYYLLADSVEAALPYLKEINETSDLSATSLFEVGMLNALSEVKTGNVEEGLSHAKSMLDRYKDLGYKPSVAYQYLMYGDMLMDAGKTADAIKIFSEGLEFSERNKIELYKGRLTKSLAESYRKIGDHKNALDYAQKYIEYSDSSYVIDRERAIEDARVRHNIALQETKIARQEQELAKERSKFYILFILLAFAIAALVAGWRVYVKKKRLYTAIVRQNNEFLLREKNLLQQIEKIRNVDSENEKSPEERKDTESDLMNRFVALMTEEKIYKDSSLTVASVAEKLCTNRTYLSRTINENTGKTFNQIVNGYRIQEAISLISDVDADIPLKQVCTESGFSSTSTFYSLFQNFTGLTPAKYRAQIKNL